MFFVFSQSSLLTSTGLPHCYFQTSPPFFLVMSVANSSAFKSLLVKIAAFYRDALVWCKALSVCILIIMVSLLCPFGNSCVTMANTRNSRGKGKALLFTTCCMEKCENVTAAAHSSTIFGCLCCSYLLMIFLPTSPYF